MHGRRVFQSIMDTTPPKPSQRPAPRSTLPPPLKNIRWTRPQKLFVLAIVAIALTVFLIRLVIDPRREPSPASTIPTAEDRDPNVVVVEIVGLPPGGVLTVDGLPAVSLPLHFARGSIHTIEASADGFVTRSLEVHANSNHTLDVSLRRAREPIR